MRPIVRYNHMRPNGRIVACRYGMFRKQKEGITIKMKQKTSKWMYLAALLMFVAAVFQITGDHWVLGACFFASAVCFMSAARIYQKKEAESEQKEANENKPEEQIG